MYLQEIVLRVLFVAVFAYICRCDEIITNTTYSTRKGLKLTQTTHLVELTTNRNNNNTKMRDNIDSYGKYNPILKIHRKQDNARIKQSLDEFTMKRRKTVTIKYGDYIEIPFKTYTVQNNRDLDDLNFKQNGYNDISTDTGYKNVETHSNNNKNIATDTWQLVKNRNKIYEYNPVDQDYYEDIYNIQHIRLSKKDLSHLNDLLINENLKHSYLNKHNEKLNIYPSNPTDSTDSNENNLLKLYIENPKLFNSMSKQTVLMEKLLQLLQNEQLAKRSGKLNDFEELLNEVESKKNQSHEHEIIEDVPRITTRAVETTTRQLSTIMTMIDETEVRKALRKDPLVNRILKLARKRRKAYVRRAKKKLEENGEEQSTF